MRLRPEHRVHGDVMFLGVQMGQHLKIVAQRQRGMVRLPGQELVVKTAAVADAVSLGVEGQPGHQHQRHLQCNNSTYEGGNWKMLPKTLANAVNADVQHHDHEHEHEHSHVPHEHHHHHEHRGLQEVIAIIDATDMSAAAKALALKIFDIIADAEAKAHAVEKNAVHFHEVGAIDSIVDIVAIAVCADSLGVENVIVPELCEGRGTVRCQHGVLPVPVPATANIMQRFGFNVRLLPVQGEFVTPTGAAAAAALMTTDELPQSFKILGIGLGAGKRQYERPSILRALLIEDNAQKKTL